MLILPPEKKRKIGSKEPENRRTLSFATLSSNKTLLPLFYKDKIEVPEKYSTHFRRKS
jgi:hypothetical protein